MRYCCLMVASELSFAKFTFGRVKGVAVSTSIRFKAQVCFGYPICLFTLLTKFKVRFCPPPALWIHFFTVSADVSTFIIALTSLRISSTSLMVTDSAATMGPA